VNAFNKSGFLFQLEGNPQPGKSHFVRYRPIGPALLLRRKLASMSGLPWKRQSAEFFLDLRAIGK
jgi:hypothetical protein